MGFLSDDSLCHSFDYRANGYSRGEGVIALVLKPVSNGIKDGDAIRAVIRSTGSNQDGRTPGLTQPSPISQEALIRKVYAKADLSLSSTRYIEAHGTGTLVGDPFEVEAIRRVFGSHRSKQEPIHIGSIKSNIGHLEACSGLAGIVKAVMILERGVIPPVALFKQVNPKIDLGVGEVNIPAQSLPWPTKGLRRISINSFGFGGTNGHVIMDDSYNFLKQFGIGVHHSISADISETKEDREEFGRVSQSEGEIASGVVVAANQTGSSDKKAPIHVDTKDDGSSMLIVWSAPDEHSLERVVLGYHAYYQGLVTKDPRNAERLAFTLSERRSHMAWRAFTTSDKLNGDDAPNLLQYMHKYRTLKEKGLVLVFTGQGAQYAGMGVELMRYGVFKETLERIDAIFKSLGCSWSVRDVLNDANKLDRPEFSQPASTAIQIAMYELFKSLGACPVAVVGHSSGEIAAA
ncbi:hypothetical protein Hte_002785 [Hypoxylon texense]